MEAPTCYAEFPKSPSVEDRTAAPPSLLRATKGRDRAWQEGGTAVACMESVATMQGGERIVQTAIDNSVDTDEIIVAPGTYFETIDFLGKAITLRAENGPGNGAFGGHRR